MNFNLALKQAAPDYKISKMCELVQSRKLQTPPHNKEYEKQT